MKDRTIVWIGIGLGVVAIVLAIFVLPRPATPTAGNVTQSFWDAKLGYKVNGTTMVNSSGQLTGTVAQTCTMISYASVAATSSQRVDCAITGAVSTDKVFVQLPVAANISPSWNFNVSAASASSTSGYVTFTLYNLTGAATSSYSQASTSVQVLDIHT